MKVCPVCKSRCFDDMDICYGCLYDFKKTNNNKNENGKQDLGGKMKFEECGQSDNYLQKSQTQKFKTLKSKDGILMSAKNSINSDFDATYIGEIDDSMIDYGNEYISFEELRDRSKSVNKSKDIKVSDKIVLKIEIPKSLIENINNF